MSKHRILYLPVETKARELLGKTFLAARAVERGWIVFMGAGGELRRAMRDRPAGAYIEMSVPDSKVARLQQIKGAGHRTANLCEESLIYPEGRDYCERKLGLGALRCIDRLLALGSVSAEHVREYRSEHVKKIAITGNPRFDVLLPKLRSVFEREVVAIRKHFGRFLLVNTSFGRANPYKTGQDALATLRAKGMIRDEAQAAFLQRHLAFKERQLKGLQRLLKEVATSGAVEKIVIRPHPSENHEMWREWAAPLNIEIRYQGSANEWMLAADAVLHPSCTTGIEGLMLDRPVFSYVPDPDTEFLNLSDAVSQPVASAAEFVGRLSEVSGLDGQEMRAKLGGQRERLGQFIANVEPPFAADRILDELEQFDLPEVDDSRAGLEGGFSRKVREGLRGWLRRFRRKDSAYSLQKLPGIAAEELHAPLSHWKTAGVLACLPRLTRFSERLWALHS